MWRDWWEALGFGSVFSGHVHLDAGVLWRAAERAGVELRLAILAQTEMAAGEEQHGHIVAAADAAGALLAELAVLVAGARVGVVDVVDVGRGAVVSLLAVAAAFLGVGVGRELLSRGGGGSGSGDVLLLGLG